MRSPLLQRFKRKRNLASEQWPVSRKLSALTRAQFVAWGVITTVSIVTASDGHGKPTVVVPLVTLLAALAAGWRATNDREDRRFWVLVSISMALSFLGFATFSTTLDSNAQAAVLPNVLFLLSYPCVIGAQILLVRRRTIRKGVGHWLDGVMCGAAFGCVMVTLVGPRLLADASGRGTWWTFLTFAFPALDVVLAACAVVLFAHLGWRFHRQMACLAAVALLLVLADTIPLVEAAYHVHIGVGPEAVVLAYAILILSTRFDGLSVLRSDDSNDTGRALVGPWLSAGVAGAVLVLNQSRLPGIALGLAAVTFFVAFSRLSLALREVRELERSRREARTDDLTGLPNRRALAERLEGLRHLDGNAEQQSAAVAIMDLDSFKEVNDTLGHEAGDELLRAIAARLARTLSGRVGTSLFRLGGDEFACVISPADEVERIALAMRAATASPIELRGVRIQQEISIGVALYPRDATESSDLLRMADSTMYRAKAARVGFLLYQHTNDRDRSHLELTAAVRKAIERRTIELHFQPQVIVQADDHANVARCSPHGLEALLRLTTPKGPISPPTVVHICEQIAMMEQLTDLVLDKALAEQRRLSRNGHHLVMSVNVSAQDISSENLFKRVDSALRRHNVDPHLVCLEVTEEALLKNEHSVVRTVNDLRRLGVRVSMDDFGVGFSSLTNLRNLAVDELKIDRSFIQDLVAGTRTAALVETMVDMAARLGAVVVAEGVETHEEAKAVYGLGVRLCQGYFYGRPMNSHNLDAWLEKRRPWLPANVSAASSH